MQVKNGGINYARPKIYSVDAPQIYNLHPEEELL
jgi:hypothetical protein